jgi:hypothetical protein
MTDSNFLQRASAMDALAVSVATTLIQSLTLIHGGAVVAIPAFANQFEVVLRPSIRLWMFGWFAAGLALAVVAGIAAFFALAARSDESLELAKTEGSINDTVEDRLKVFRRWRYAALVSIIVSTFCLCAGAWTSLSVLLASDTMHQTAP